MAWVEKIEKLISEGGGRLLGTREKLDKANILFNCFHIFVTFQLGNNSKSKLWINDNEDRHLVLTNILGIRKKSTFFFRYDSIVTMGTFFYGYPVYLPLNFCCCPSLDNKALFLVSTSKDAAQIYEIVCDSYKDKKE